MTTIFIISIYAALSLVMGFFSVTQMGYQHRMGIIEALGKGILAFLKGFFTWPILFPLGVKNGKYKMNVHHKVGNTSESI